VTSNIAEGHNLWGTPSNLRHVRIALGSLGETTSQLLFARDRNYVDKAQSAELISEAGAIHRQLLALIRSLQQLQRS
jgi:four helix bundle protein